ncbi:MAG: ferredoxin-type protein NapG [Bacteroidota bacterium]
MSKEVKSRREWFKSLFQYTGLVGVGGVAWGTKVHEDKTAKLVLRPPGALEETDFVKACIKCGLCIEDCPYDTLQLAKPGTNLPIGTPYFIPREIPCYMCTDIPCVKICPTNALSEPLVSDIEEDDKVKLNINKAEMGVAVLDTESCLAYWGIRCDACYRACPLIDEAITLDYERNERTGKHALIKPKINIESCTGCGMCEHACITEKAAIFVLPREIALGKVKTDYIKGWDKKDEQRIDTTNVYKDKGKTDKQTLDYLNDPNFLIDEE